MRGLIPKIAVAWALACGCLAPAACGDDTPAESDGGGGAGAGSGGSGGSEDAGGGGDTGHVGCLTDAATVCPTPPVTYAKVQPIFQARCVNVCHNGATIDPVADAAIWALTDYGQVADWNATIRSSIGECSMPPPDAGVPVTVEERRTILEWIRCGYPQ